MAEKQVPAFLTPKRSNGPQPQLPQARTIEEELSEVTRAIERSGDEQLEKEHPALAACRRAAEQIRKVHEAHAGESETLAGHIEQIGQTIMDFCKEAANKIRQQRIMPEEMAAKTADELINMGREESLRQARVARGLTAARDAIIGIDAKDQP